MLRFFPLGLACALLLTGLPQTSRAANAQVRPRYAASWDDGTHSWGDDLGAWNGPNAEPRLSGRALFSSAAPVRWLQDTRIPPAGPPQAMVELVGWDRIPGRVAGIRPGGDPANHYLPAYLILNPEKSADRPGTQTTEGVRILLRWVQRIVCQAVTTHYQPNTLFLRDGRQLAYRSLRFTDDGVRALKLDGIEDVPLAAIAELHMPATDAWDAYYEQAAVLSPDGAARLMQLETDGGLRVTSSSLRFQADSGGNGGDPNHWLHMVQPAWSLDPLWISYHTIRLRRYFDVARVPLSCIAPVSVRQHSEFGSSWPWQADQSVQGGPLESGSRVFQWGFGVHAQNELEFALPAAAESFRTSLGLDAAVGDGGCVRASVRLSTNPGRPLYESSILIGSSNLVDTGTLPLGRPADSSARLILRTDSVSNDRPPGSDPFDIRDDLDWLEPELLLNRTALRAEVARRSVQLIPAWRNWDVRCGDQAGAPVVSYWDPEAAPRPCYRLAAGMPDRPITISRRVTITDRNDQLLLLVSRPPDASFCQVEIRVDGTLWRQVEVGIRRNMHFPDPIEMSLDNYHGRTVTIEITQRGQGPRPWVEWEYVGLEANDFADD